jgi:hypothetical protein
VCVMFVAIYSALCIKKNRPTPCHGMWTCHTDKNVMVLVNIQCFFNPFFLFLCCFFFYTELCKHRLLHTGQKNNLCDVCNKAFLFFMLPPRNNTTITALLQNDIQLYYSAITQHCYRMTYSCIIQP